MWKLQDLYLIQVNTYLKHKAVPWTDKCYNGLLYKRWIFNSSDTEALAICMLGTFDPLVYFLCLFLNWTACFFSSPYMFIFFPHSPNPISPPSLTDTHLLLTVIWGKWSLDTWEWWKARTEKPGEEGETNYKYSWIAAAEASQSLARIARPETLRNQKRYPILLQYPAVYISSISPLC